MLANSASRSKLLTRDCGATCMQSFRLRCTLNSVWQWHRVRHSRTFDMLSPGVAGGRLATKTSHIWRCSGKALPFVAVLTTFKTRLSANLKARAQGSLLQPHQLLVHVMCHTDRHHRACATCFMIAVSCATLVSCISLHCCRRSSSTLTSVAKPAPFQRSAPGSRQRTRLRSADAFESVYGGNGKLSQPL